MINGSNTTKVAIWFGFKAREKTIATAQLRKDGDFAHVYHSLSKDGGTPVLPATVL